MDGTQFVTARGWEDLSNLLNTYESLGLQADEELIRQYIQHQKIAEDFSAYLDLYYKYRDDYGVEDILAGQAKPAAFARLLQAPFRREAEPREPDPVRPRDALLCLPAGRRCGRQLLCLPAGDEESLCRDARRAGAGAELLGAAL